MKNRRNLTITIAALAAFSMSSCSSLVERATERAVEEGIERAIEADSGENVELDFNADDGTFRIETDEGSFSVDGEEGTFVLETEEGTFEGQGDENGFEVTNEDGTTVLDINGDDESGSLTIETEDGTFTSSTGEGDWSLWPAEVARPNSIILPAVGGVEADGELWAYAVGEVEADPQRAVDEYVATLDGFEVVDSISDEGYALTHLTDGNYLVEVSSAENSLYVSVSNG